MKKSIVLFVLLLVVGIMAGCGAQVDNGEVVQGSKYPITVTDKYGNEVVIEGAPEKIISMSPELTEIIYALGSGDAMIGRSKYCNYPEAVTEIDDFGSLFDLNVESIVEAEPDVVFLSSMASEELVLNMIGQGLTVLTIDKDGTLDGTYSHISFVGDILDKQDEATLVVADIKAQIDGVTKKVEGLEKPTTYHVVYAAEGYHSTATGDTFINDVIEAAGAENVAADGTDWQYTVEKLVEKDPAILTCTTSNDAKATIESLAGYSDLTAVIEGRLFEIQEDIISRQGPRIGEAVEALAKIYHPEAFE